MQFGFNLPNTGALAAPDVVVRITREGEALGYDYLTVTDHVVLPDMAEPGYPYSESGAFYSRDSAHRHEMLTLALIWRRLRRSCASCSPCWSCRIARRCSPRRCSRRSMYCRAAA